MDRQGYISFIGILIFGILLIAVLEIYRDMEIYRNTKVVMERVVNMSTSLAISDNSREGNAVLSSQKAQSFFYELLNSEFGLDADYTFGDNYQLTIQNLSCVDCPPRIEVRGSVQAAPFLLNSGILQNIKINLPFHIKSRIQHIGY